VDALLHGEARVIRRGHADRSHCPR
jgi:hypothetical protein